MLDIREWRHVGQWTNLNEQTAHLKTKFLSYKDP